MPARYGRAFDAENVSRERYGFLITLVCLNYLIVLIKNE